MPGANLGSLGDEHAIIVVLAYADLSEAGRERLDEVKRRRTSRRKIADIGIIRPLPERDIVNELWNEPVQVHIALAVGMGRKIDWDAIHKTGEIRAMVEI